MAFGAHLEPACGSQCIPSTRVSVMVQRGLRVSQHLAQEPFEKHSGAVLPLFRNRFSRDDARNRMILFPRNNIFLLSTDSGATTW